MLGSIVWLNGAFLPLDEARISPLDRGFLFADGVYEVIPAYRGRLFTLELAAGAAIPYQEREIPATELATAQELWMTNITTEMPPITQVDGRPVGDGCPGPLGGRLAELFQDYKNRACPP